jgi:hypothetical protein
VAIAFPQGLADTAKKERARRKKAAATSPTKVYTESDLPTAPVGATPSQKEAGPDDVKPDVGAAEGEQSARRDRERRAMEAMRSAEATDFGMRIAGLKQRIAEVEAQVKQLGNHPTGGGKVCKLAPGVFVPGVTAPELVVCPAQMESRYDVAKRTLETLKADLATLMGSAARAGVVVRRP